MSSNYEFQSSTCIVSKVAGVRVEAEVQVGTESETHAQEVLVLRQPPVLLLERAETPTYVLSIVVVGH